MPKFIKFEESKHLSLSHVHANVMEVNGFTLCHRGYEVLLLNLIYLIRQQPEAEPANDGKQMGRGRGGGPGTPPGGRPLVQALLVRILSAQIFSFPVFALKPSTNVAGDRQLTGVIKIPRVVAAR